MADSDDDDFHFVGTPLEEEAESRAGQRPRPGAVAKDAAATRSLPIHKQVTFIFQPFCAIHCPPKSLYRVPQGVCLYTSILVLIPPVLDNPFLPPKVFCKNHACQDRHRAMLPSRPLCKMPPHSLCNLCSFLLALTMFPTC
jgi:hypothetical protein